MMGREPAIESYSSSDSSSRMCGGHHPPQPVRQRSRIHDLAVTSVAKLGVERLPQTVAEQVDADDGQGNGEAWKCRDPPRHAQIVAAVAQIEPPFRRRLRRAKTQEA